MVQLQDTRDRIGKARALVIFYRDALATMLNQTKDERLLILIRLTLHDTIKIESDPLLYASHTRRHPDLVSSWLNKIEERLRAIDADYKTLAQHFEFGDSSRS